MTIQKYFLASAIVSGYIASQVLPAKAYDFFDFVKDNAPWIRSKTVSTIYEQTFVQDMSDGELNQYKKKYGNPGYIAYVDNWCGNQVYGQGYRNVASAVFGRSGIVDGVHATWRYEEGKVNCYFRTAGKH